MPTESGGTWTADRRLYLDKAGKVVEEDDPNRHSLLAGKGQTIPMTRARQLGLVDDQGQTVKPEKPEGDRAVKPTEPEKPARPPSKDEDKGEIGTLADEAKKQSKGR